MAQLIPKLEVVIFDPLEHSEYDHTFGQDVPFVFTKYKAANKKLICHLNYILRRGIPIHEGAYNILNSDNLTKGRPLNLAWDRGLQALIWQTADATKNYDNDEFDDMDNFINAIFMDRAQELYDDYKKKENLVKLK